MDGLNSAVSEQVFAWFRGYARNFNSMKPLRHHFLVLYCCRRHNACGDANDTEHLNKYKKAAAKSRGSYDCAVRRRAKFLKSFSMKKYTMKKTVMKKPSMKHVMKKIK